MSDDQQAAIGNPGRKAPQDTLIGLTLEGRYLIEEVLGTGGVSVVYKAKQLRFNRYVAVKMMKMQFEKDAVHRERFEREMASLSALSHPNIVTVYDCTYGPDGQPCVVMDFLKGRSLEALINEEGALDVSRFAHIAVQIVAALDHAHKKGVIHRDLKPGNIVLMDEEHDFVKVVDFGLARLREENKRLTQTGEFWGSPAYMSPEQCRGKSGDERSDLYSFGAVMFEMLTGKDPFHDAGSVLDVLHKHGFVTPPSFHTVNPEVSVAAELESVVRKCLEKDPEARWQSATELQRAIIQACTTSVGRAATDQLLSLAQSRAEQPALKTSTAPSARTESPAGVAPDRKSLSAKVLLMIGAPVLLLIIVIGSFLFQSGSKQSVTPVTNAPTTSIQPTTTSITQERQPVPASTAPTSSAPSQASTVAPPVVSERTTTAIKKPSVQPEQTSSSILNRKKPPMTATSAQPAQKPKTAQQMTVQKVQSNPIVRTAIDEDESTAGAMLPPLPPPPGPLGEVLIEARKKINRLPLENPQPPPRQTLVRGIGQVLKGVRTVVEEPQQTARPPAIAPWTLLEKQREEEAKKQAAKSAQ